MKNFQILLLSVCFTFTFANSPAPFYTPAQNPIFAESPLLEEAAQKPLFYAQSGPFAGILLDSLWGVPMDRRTNFSTRALDQQGPYLLGQNRQEWADEKPDSLQNLHFIFGNEVGDPLFNELEAKEISANKTPFLGVGTAFQSPFGQFYLRLEQDDHWSIHRLVPRQIATDYQSNTKTYNPEKAKSWFGENTPLISILKAGWIYNDRTHNEWQAHLQDGWMWQDAPSGDLQLFRIHQWSAAYHSLNQLNVHYYGNSIEQELLQKQIYSHQFEINKKWWAIEQEWILGASFYNVEQQIQGVINLENNRPFELFSKNTPDTLSPNQLRTQVQVGHSYFHLQNQLNQLIWQTSYSSLNILISGEVANQQHPFDKLSTEWLEQKQYSTPEQVRKKAYGSLEYKQSLFTYRFLPWRAWGLFRSQTDSLFYLNESWVRVGQEKPLSGSLGSLEQQLELYWPSNPVTINPFQTRGQISVKGYLQPHFEKTWNEVDFLPPLYRGQIQADAYLSTDLSLAARIHWSSPWYLRAWSEKSIQYKPAPNFSLFFNQALFKHKLNAKIAALNVLAFKAQNSIPQHPNGSPDCFRILTGIEASF